MKKTIIRKLTALTLVFALSSLLLASCGYNDSPLPEYEYPTQIQTFDNQAYFDSSEILFSVDDEDLIKDFIDMINNCQFKKTELENLDSLQLFGFFLKDKVAGEARTVDFYITQDGSYLLLTADIENYIESENTVTAYKIRGFDCVLMKQFIKQ